MTRRRVDLLETLREELEHRRGRFFGLVAADHDRGADDVQRKALFSFSKKPSSER